MKKTIPTICLLLTLIGCVPTEKLKYGIDKDKVPTSYKNDPSEKTIQPFDYLYIKIYSLDDKTAGIFESDSRSYQSEELISYSVNSKGFINFPFIGDIMVKGLTIDDAKIKIEKELNKYLSNISVRMRFVGNKITVLGEVNRPGNYAFYDEKITVFQALGLANDIANFGNKTKVTLIREKDNEIKYHYLDLSKTNIVESDYFYLLPNDILIVDPVKAKYRSLQNYSALYLLFTTISTALGVYNVTK